MSKFLITAIAVTYSFTRTVSSLQFDEAVTYTKVNSLRGNKESNKKQ